MRMSVYAAMIDRLDQNVGKILACLESSGQLENTTVIFLSDNGGCEEHHEADGSNIKRYDLPMTNGEHPRMGNVPGLMPGPENTFQTYGISWANASNTPFRQFKKWVHEGGIATPLIIHVPGLEGTAGRIVHDPCHAIDIMPTILDFTGVRHPQQFGGREMIPLEGQSLAPVVSASGAVPERSIFWEHMGNRAARMGSMKLVAENKGQWELYDLASDRTELNDLAGRNPGAVLELQRQYDEWSRRVRVEDFNELQRKARNRER
jgi:arylsulfatase